MVTTQHFGCFASWRPLGSPWLDQGNLLAMVMVIDADHLSELAGYNCTNHL